MGDTALMADCTGYSVAASGQFPPYLGGVGVAPGLRVDDLLQGSEIGIDNQMP